MKRSLRKPININTRYVWVFPILSSKKKNNQIILTTFILHTSTLQNISTYVMALKTNMKLFGTLL